MNSIRSHQPENQNARTENGKEIQFWTILQIIAENFRFLLLAPLTTGLLALAICLLIPPKYTANTKFLPPQPQAGATAGALQSLGSLGSIAGISAGLKNPTDQFIAFLKTRSVQDPLIKQFDLQNRYKKKYKDTTRKELEKNTDIKSGKDNIISIDFDDENPEVAAQIANAYVDNLNQLINRLNLTEAQARRAFFEKQLIITKANLAEAEQTLKDSGVSPAVLNTNPIIALDGPARLRAQITALEIRIQAMRSYLTASAPEFRQAQSELFAAKQELAKMGNESDHPSRKTNIDYNSKYREYKYQEALFEIFSKQFEIAKADESRDGTIQIIDIAHPPEHKSKPNRLMILTFTSTATFFLSILYLIISNRIKSDIAFKEKISDFLHTLTKNKKLKPQNQTTNANQ